MPQNSATLGYCRARGLHVDHYGLNKFGSPEDGNFKTVRDAIEKLYICALERDATRSASLKSSSITVTGRGNPYKYDDPAKAERIAKVSLLTYKNLPISPLLT